MKLLKLLKLLNPLCHLGRLMLIVSVLHLAGCSIYHPNIEQGNILTTEQIEGLRVGMSPLQVLNLLGSSVLQNIFNPYRWDYVYRVLQNNGQLDQHIFTVHFDKTGSLMRWEGEAALVSAPTLSPKNVLSSSNFNNNINNINDNNNNDNNDSHSSNSSIVNIPSATEPLRPEVLATHTPSPVLSLAPPITVPALDNNNSNNSNNSNNFNNLTNLISDTTTPPKTSTSITVANTQATQANTEQYTEQQLLAPDLEATLNQRVRAWKATWQTKNLADYAHFYTPNYSAELESHTDWLAHRQRVFDKAGEIMLTLKEIKVIQTSETEARVTFSQIYQSNRLVETGVKQLFFKNIDGTWLIVAERFVRMP